MYYTIPTHLTKPYLTHLGQADTSKDGRIDFEEFQTIMQNKAPGPETPTWSGGYITHQNWD